MLRKHSRSVVAAGVSLLVAVSFGFADFLIDDFNDKDNKNEIGTYWYFYDDNTPGGTSKVTNDPFESGGVNEDGVAVMEYTFGDSVVKTDYTLYPFVGLGFNFIGEGKTPYDLTGATAISFDIWADKATKVKFLLETSDCTSDDKLHSIISVGTTKANVKVLLEVDKTLTGALRQEGWGLPKIPTYDPTKNLKVAFQLRGNENTTFGKGTKGKLFVDNFNIVGSPKIRKWGELDTVALGTYKSDLGLLSDFSSETPTINNLKGEWFIYNDKDNDGASKFTKGFDADDDKKFIVDETGGANGSAGVSMAFELGPKLLSGTDSIFPYVGVGCNILKGGRSGYDAKTGGATGLYLEYKSNIYVNVEVDDSINRGAGVVYYAVLPPTGTKWAGVKIPFDSLKKPQWLDQMVPNLVTTGLRKIQFKLSGAAKQEGTFAFDNIYFMGATFSSGIIARSHKLINNNIDINQIGNVVNVRFNGKSALEGGSVSLLNTMGKVVAAKSINKDANTCTLPLGNNASGVYLLRVTSEHGMVETLPVHLFR